MTNEEFRTDEVFIEACKLANCSPTRRQASKYRRGQGKAFKFYREAYRNVRLQTQCEGKVSAA